RRVPDATHRDSAALKAYAEALLRVAVCLDRALGESAPLAGLASSAATNPLLQWESKLREAQSLTKGFRFGDARMLLERLLPEVESLRGSGADKYLPITYGMLADCHFQEGQAARAVQPFEQALALCRSVGDRDGVGIYLENLCEVYRYLGQFEPAAERLDALAAVREIDGDSAKVDPLRKRAERIRAGEPLNRVVVDCDGELLEIDAVPPGRPTR